MFERLSHLLKREPTFAQALSQVEASAALVALVKSSLPAVQKGAVQACYVQRNALIVVVNSHGNATKMYAQQSAILRAIGAKLPDCTDVRIQVQANVISQVPLRISPKLPASAKPALARAREASSNEKLKGALQRLEDLAGK
jgi:Dna[CI] antecedent, DciA